MNSDTCENKGSFVAVGIFSFLFFLVMVGILKFFACIFLGKFGEIKQVRFKYVVILLIVCVTVIFICYTVIVISANEACLRRKKLDMLKSVLSGGVSFITNAKTFSSQDLKDMLSNAPKGGASLSIDIASISAQKLKYGASVVNDIYKAFADAVSEV
ncbi:MAG: hypothetical protein J6K96_10980 [Treponema sp.]|nr:hypothetical protein [Treponema sp.]